MPASQSGHTTLPFVGRTIPRSRRESVPRTMSESNPRSPFGRGTTCVDTRSPESATLCRRLETPGFFLKANTSFAHNAHANTAAVIPAIPMRAHIALGPAQRVQVVRLRHVKLEVTQFELRTDTASRIWQSAQVEHLRQTITPE
jgi:hypothetical protein